MKVNHWITFGTFAEQRYYIYPRIEAYDGIILNANMVAHAPSGLAAFLLGKVKPGLPYLIDPITHAFQHEVSAIINPNNEVKSSIKKLSEEYGDLIKSLVGKRPILPDDFRNKEILEDFVICCLNFQKEKLDKSIKESDSFKYIVEDYKDQISKPLALVPPYFYMTETTFDEWLPINIEAIKIAIEKEKDNYKIYPSIVISKGILLDEKLIENLKDRLLDINPRGFLIWVDDLDESNTSVNTLRSLLYLVRSLRNRNNNEVINLHGSYFSILAGGDQLGESGFSGVSHGPEFGEFRKVIPVGGGIPIAKYYIYDLHKRINYKEALGYFKSKGWLKNVDTFYENVCNCEVCRSVINNDISNFTEFGKSETKQVRRKSGYITMEYPVQSAKDNCLKHYLWKKNDEFENIKSKDQKQLIDELNFGYDEFIEIGGLDVVAHLKLWLKTFNP